MDRCSLPVFPGEGGARVKELPFRCQILSSQSIERVARDHKDSCTDRGPCTECRRVPSTFYEPVVDTYCLQKYMYTYEIQLASDRRAFRKVYAYDRARLIAPTRV